MLAFLRNLGLGFIGLMAMVVIYWGWGWWLAWAMNVGEEHGPEWRWVALAGGLVATVAAGWALFRLQDRASQPFDYRMGRRAPEDRLYCQRCGAEVPRSAPVCGTCGGTRFALNDPKQAHPAS